MKGHSSCASIGNPVLSREFPRGCMTTPKALLTLNVLDMGECTGSERRFVEAYSSAEARAGTSPMQTGEYGWRVLAPGEVVSMKAGSCLCKGRYPSMDAVQRTQRSRNGFLPPSRSTGSPQVELFFFPCT